MSELVKYRIEEIINKSEERDKETQYVKERLRYS